MLRVRKGEAEKFVAGLDKWLAELDEHLDQTFRGFCVSVYHYIVHETPQWTGHAAANWNLSVGSPDMSEDRTLMFALDEAHRYPTPREGPSEKGHPRALALADQRNTGRDLDITVDTPVFITNAATDAQRQEYLDYLESGSGSSRPLRGINMPGHMRERAIGFYGNLGKISPGLQASLKSRGIPYSRKLSISASPGRSI